MPDLIDKNISFEFFPPKTDVLEQFLRVRYAISMNFIDVLKKTWMLLAKNAKLQYANEIKCKLSKIAKIV